jgi:hypothetical protein
MFEKQPSNKKQYSPKLGLRFSWAYPVMLVKTSIGVRDINYNSCEVTPSPIVSLAVSVIYPHAPDAAQTAVFFYRFTSAI